MVLFDEQGQSLDGHWGHRGSRERWCTRLVADHNIAICVFIPKSENISVVESWLTVTLQGNKICRESDIGLRNREGFGNPMRSIVVS